MLPSVLTSISINRLRCFIALSRTRFDHFDASALEKRLFVVFCAMFAVWPSSAGLMRAFLGRSAAGVSARAFLAMVRRRNRRQVSMFGHCFLANCSQALDSLVNAVLHEKPEIERDHSTNENQAN